MKRFYIITEADARVLEVGSTVELTAAGLVTPLAQDTLRERRIEIVRVGATVKSGSLAPVADIRIVTLGSDHTGLHLRRHLRELLRSRGLAVHDVGTDGTDPVDYPDIAVAVGRPVANGEAHAGIVIDAAGIGSAIAANKVRGVRAAMCTNVTLARYARQHNGANVLTLGATLVTDAEAEEIVGTFLETPMREARYLCRLEKIRDLEERR
jgi:ribose 5-phosphate isomerase B